VLFFTGRQHAPVNPQRVLKRLTAGLPAPIEMSHVLSRNAPKSVELLLANCLAHYLDSGVIQSECVGGP
jgi:hypothetical protein